MDWLIFGAATLLKLFFVNSYRSTDFEVHRNWMAITHSKPVSQWYLESTSEWTLDYPPFFAYFEWLLSQLAYYVDPEMLKVDNLEYASTATILFQRFSVIFVDIVLFLSLKYFAKTFFPSANVDKTSIKGRKVDEDMAISAYINKKTLALMIITLFNAGLIIVDHIHFQYNGMLLGILIFSIAAIQDDKPLLGAFFFAILLQFKHIFLYIAPVYAIYLLRIYCFKPGIRVSPESLQLLNIIKLGFVVVSVFVVSIGPFIWMGQLPQLLARLFPFKRGLVHAYWAPNFWALYLALDLVLEKLLGVPKTSSQTAMSGIVGAGSCSVLPDVSPIATLLLTVIFMLPVLVRVWQTPTKKFFIAALVQISLCSFMFGWHVHEKAILMVIVPLGLLAVEDPQYARWYLLFSLVGHYSLMPLLFKPEENTIRLGLVVAHWSASYTLLQHLHDLKNPLIQQLSLSFSSFDRFVSGGLLYIYGMTEYILPKHVPSLPFLPLMTTSVYCAAMVAWLWLTYTSVLVKF